MRQIIASAVLPLALLVTATIAAPTSLSAQTLSADGNTPGLKIEIQDLKRDEGGTVTLRFQLINESDKHFDAGCALRETSSDECGTISGVHLIDAANKKKYLVVRDASNKCACARLHRVDKGAKVNLWAKFAAPPTQVQKITVVVPEFQPVESVPITER